MSDQQAYKLPVLAENFDHFFDTSTCGFIITDPDGNILRINQQTALWMNSSPEAYRGRRFSDLLAVASKIYFETHLWPLVRMQGHFDEVAIELADSGNGKLPVYINGYEPEKSQEQSEFIRFTLFRASDRRLYEQNLQTARQLAEKKLIDEQQNAALREQFIAVLGHDLRNPLGGIISAAQMLARTELGKNEERFVKILLSSSKRMHEMIDNVMDLARGRLGGGIGINNANVNLQKLLQEVMDELAVAWPDRTIKLQCDTDRQVSCDKGRIAQLTSNLIANAITHGAADTPVIVHAVTNDTAWQITVSNQGKPIPDKALPHLFHPFHREDAHSSQNGLGLGLYIASEIAKAHSGLLTVNSDAEITSFVLQVNH